jgi:hypothetical protein
MSTSLPGARHIQNVGINIIGGSNALGIAGHVTSGNGDAIHIFGSSNTVNLVAGSSVIGGSVGIGINGGANKITIAGEVTGRGLAGVQVQDGGSNVVTIASNGRVVGQAGILFPDFFDPFGDPPPNQVINNGSWAPHSLQSHATKQGRLCSTPARSSE